MFGALGNIASLFKHAQQLGGRLEGMTESLRSRRAVGMAGGGMVEVEINGLQEVLRCRIDPSLISQGDQELLEDLLRAAINQAVEKSRQLHTQALQELASNVQVPGLADALSKYTGPQPG